MDKVVDSFSGRIGELGYTRTRLSANPSIGQNARARHRFFVAEILGNPFRPVQIEPSWRTTNIVHLAQAIYHSRSGNALDGERFPILADALEDVGCTDRTLLDHLRGGKEHVRGCWAIDALLGKG